MIIIPAIDLKDGLVVRLLQGNFDKVTVYSKDPVGFAKKFENSGAKFMHIVDLDGAKTGELKNIDIIKNILKNISIPVEFGGGVRNKETIELLLNLGIERVILTTKAVEDENFLKKIVKEFGHHIAVSIDSKSGFLAMRGWVEVSKIKAVDFAAKISKLGVKTIIFTDVATDGALSGPNIKSLKEILNAVSENSSVVSSGGISSMEDIKNLKKIGNPALEGVIIGRAIYEGKIDLKEAVEICLQKE